MAREVPAVEESSATHAAVGSVAIVIPAHNEGRNLGPVLQSLPKGLPGFPRLLPIVVDDGSSDDTRRIALAAGARVLRHRVNLGMGQALISGTEAAIANGADIVVHMDGDGQHSPDDLPALLEPFTRGAQFVSGVREFSGQMPLVMRFGNYFLSMAMKI